MPWAKPSDYRSLSITAGWKPVTNNIYDRGTGLQPDVGLMGKIHRQMLTHFPMVTQILASSQNGIGGYPRYPILSYAAPTWLARM